MSSIPRRRLLVVVSVVVVIAIVLVVASLDSFSARPAPTYPSITVTNSNQASTVNWTLPKNATAAWLASFNLTATVVENSTGNISTLSMSAKLGGFYVSLWSQMDFDLSILVTGNFSPSLHPPSVSISFDNIVNGTVPAVLAWLLPAGSNEPPPVNLTSYDLGGPGCAYSGWGGVTNSTGLANESSVGGHRYFFAFPSDVDTQFPQPPSGLSSYTALDFRASLDGLGTPVYCHLSILVETFNPA
jgi:hypothetical protein